MPAPNEPTQVEVSCEAADPQRNIETMTFDQLAGLITCIDKLKAVVQDAISKSHTDYTRF